MLTNGNIAKRQNDNIFIFFLIVLFVLRVKKSCYISCRGLNLVRLEYSQMEHACNTGTSFIRPYCNLRIYTFMKTVKLQIYFVASVF